MTTTVHAPKILLVPGHWLGAWAWDEVADRLSDLGRDATALTLPGLDPSDPLRATKSLEDQVAALRQAATASGAPVAIAAHSGANAPVSMLMDRHPELIARVVWVDSGPATPGAAFAPGFTPTPDELSLPDVDALAQQASLEGISDEALERFRALAVPEPGPVLREPVPLSNEARYGVPSTFVCCSFSSDQVKELVRAGHPMFADVARFTGAEYVDLATGHWPMWSRPAELAEIIAAASAMPDPVG